MKVITIWQPWASMIVMGAKKIETRHWNTKHRGPLLIHAAKKMVRAGEFPVKILDYLFETIPGEDYDKLPYGAIIGRVNLVDTIQFSDDARTQIEGYKGNKNPWIPFREKGNDFDSLDETDEWMENIDKELAFGDFSTGRYGWILDNPVKFDEPIPFKGQQGFFNYNGFSGLI